MRRTLAIGLAVVTLVGLGLACRSPAPREETDVKLFGFGKKTAPATVSIPRIDLEVPPVVRTATFAVG